MATLHRLDRSHAGPVSESTLLSFQNGGYEVCRIDGPIRLARLTCERGIAPEGQGYDANRADGAFWFFEEDLIRLRAVARADLASNSGSVTESRLGFYLRLVLRDTLAVRRDWTPAFDTYSVLALPGGKSLVALVGFIAGQPVYSPDSAPGRRASEGGISLGGGWRQLVIGFDRSPNIGLQWHIQGLQAL